LPAKIGRGGSEKRFEQGVDVADANIFACDNDQAPPDCAAVECVKRASRPLRQLNIAPADRFLKDARRNPTITSQWGIDYLARAMQSVVNAVESLFVEQHDSSMTQVPAQASEKRRAKSNNQIKYVLQIVDKWSSVSTPSDAIRTIRSIHNPPNLGGCAAWTVAAFTLSFAPILLHPGEVGSIRCVHAVAGSARFAESYKNRAWEEYFMNLRISRASGLAVALLTLPLLSSGAA